MTSSVIEWLLQGDISLQYQTYRDLMDDDRRELQQRILLEGWGERFLSFRNEDGSWGKGFYRPKWTCSNYTLLDLKALAVLPDHFLIRESIHAFARSLKGRDGGINPARTVKVSDVCINGMFLNYACYFGEKQDLFESIVDFILDQKMEDGGFNCKRNRSQGTRHSSLHSTLAVLEGVFEYKNNGYMYRVDELTKAATEAIEFILRHRFFKSDHTGKIIHGDLLKLSFPPRWKYNILRALDFFRLAQVPWDERMSDAVSVILRKRRADKWWHAESFLPGVTHFTMEEAGKPSRWNTLIAKRVLKYYKIE